MGLTRPAAQAAIAGWLWLLLAAGPALASAVDPAPVVAHEPLSSFTTGGAVIVKARVRSPAGKRIFSPAVFVKAAGLKLARVPLEPVEGEVHTFAAVIPAALTQGDFEYYVEAFDEEGNGPSRIGGPEALIKVRAVPPAPSKREAAEGTAIGVDAPARPWQRTAAIAGLGAGGALAAGGLLCGALGFVAKRDMERAADDAQYDAAKRRGKGLAAAANALVATGLVAAGAGAALLWLPSKRGAGPGAQLGFIAGPGGATALVAGRF